MTTLLGTLSLYYSNLQVVQAEAQKTVDYQQVYNDIANLLDRDSDYDDGSYGPLFLRLAWHTSGTFSDKEKDGGSRFGTMRFDKEISRGSNLGLDIARDLLEKEVQAKHPGISTGDLYTLAGVVAVQELGGPDIPWRPGRVDGGQDKLVPDGRLPDADQGSAHVRDVFYRMKFDDEEIAALIGGHALGRCHLDRLGYDGPWTDARTVFDNSYYTTLLERTWVPKTVSSGKHQFESGTLMMLPAEIDMLKDAKFKKFYEVFAKDQDKFFKVFSKALVKLLENGVPFTGKEKVYVFKRVNE
ncbi:heme peroxidase [Hesseltinella vesiculosa]|uniref:Peroxidase n=1 Tax=Hesseltinella vesiculosa TaxID=101127 RepID=A0A1X2GNS0_9FUNG|nr:heme peroxidase [Hesseltinella vesiculosa]